MRLSVFFFSVVGSELGGGISSLNLHDFRDDKFLCTLNFSP